MPYQSVLTGLDGIIIDTDIRTGLRETRDAATEVQPLVPLIGGQQSKYSGVAVTPESGTLDISDEDVQQLAVALTDQQIRTFSIPPHLIPWATANPAIATVTLYGLVQPVAAGGPINITGTIQGTTDAYAVTVQD